MAVRTRPPLRNTEMDLNVPVNLKSLKESHAWKWEQERQRIQAAFDRLGQTRDRSMERERSPLLLPVKAGRNGRQEISSLLTKESMPRRSRPRERARSAHSRRVQLNLTDDQLKTQLSTQVAAPISPPAIFHKPPMPPARIRNRTASPSTRKIVNIAPENTDSNKGLKLFKNPVQKSNKLLIRNAIQDACLAGLVHEDLRIQVLEALERSDAQHFLILFRDALYCQFRGLYYYDFYTNCAKKLYGTGPVRIMAEMIERLFKYDSGAKKFIPLYSTQHVSLQTDGITIQSGLWLGKKTIS